MARSQTTDCDSCPNGRIEFGAAFCRSCGHPSTWASYDERIDWEITQWRRTRERSAGSGVATIEALPAAPSLRSSRHDRNFDRHDAVITLDPDEFAALEPTGNVVFFERFQRLVRRLGEIFGSSLKLPLDPKPQAPAVEAIHEEPVIVQEENTIDPVDVAAAEAVVVEEPALSVVEGPALSTEPDVLEEPAEAQVATEAIPTPAPILVRKRPNRPTNKDLLKRTLDVLTRVEQRLEHLELEVAGLDMAARGTNETSEPDGQDDLSLDGVDVLRLPF